MNHAPLTTTNAKRKFDYICPLCGSNEVAHDATVRWDATLQRFYLTDVQDHCTCQNCSLEDDDGSTFFKMI